MTPRKILVIDDDESNLAVLHALLSQTGHEVEGAPNGAAGLELAEANADFDLIFVDIHLPDIGGIEVIRRLRQQRPDTVIVAATIDDNEETLTAAYQAGCDIFMVKPYNVAQLTRLLQTAERGQRWVVDRLGIRPYSLN
jgi:CheY-like chemotaxis protein